MMKLADILPEFSEELSQGLAALGHMRLSESVHSLEIVERCACDEPGCVTFYAVPKTSAPAWPACQRVIAPARGVLCVHHANQQIIWVEAHGRPEDRVTLDQLYKLHEPTVRSTNS